MAQPAMTVRRIRTLPPLPPELAPSDHEVYPTKYDICATGYCAGCGRTLIDATRQQRAGYFKGHCWPCWVAAGRPPRR